MDSEVLAQQPTLAPRLKQNGVKIEQMVEVLRWDDQPESQSFVAIWDENTPATRSLAGIEALGLGAGLTSRRLWEVFQGALLVQSRESISAQIALAQPKIVAVTIRGALKAKGHADREHLFKASGFLPVPKGSTITINPGMQQALPQGHSEEDGSGGDLEPCDDFLMRASRAMNAKRLEAPKDPEVIDAEEVE